MSPSSPRKYRRPRQDQQQSSTQNETSSTTSVSSSDEQFTRVASANVTTTVLTTSSSSSLSSSSPISSSSLQSSSLSSSFSSTSSSSTPTTESTSSSSDSSSSSQTTSVATSSFSSSSVTTITSSSNVSAPTSEYFLVTESEPTSSLFTFSPVPTPVTYSIPPTNSTSSQSAAEASSKGFWSDKKAVAGTFTALALIILGIGFAIVIFSIRKRRRNKARASDRDTLFDKFPPEPGLVSTPRPISSSTHSISEDLHRMQPMDPDATAGNYYQHQNMIPFSDPPYATGSLTEITYSYAKDVNNQYPIYDEGLIYGSANSSNQHLNPPSQTSFDTHGGRKPGGASSSSESTSSPFRAPLPGAGASRRISPGTRSATRDRDSYQPSLDSFYGVEGVGYAR
ncbi:hypothetical protein E1B28_004149 [Marasmius oreades]|uniref:Uncharacterized protein n=1 Tax=Marasmius oreades TaxID=181124 RepID=A0A9P7UY13_9AGAR|nr:uncharacterized protein E1B28_004149 [Marasmius oreades]KAG7096736.1 hypothetical protein E1B28_004149 [Marasmius oreades]